ncbi:MAG: aspartyl/asparaginyl beta-hydroxylase domain-containing protein [Pseudomonadota bacterium]|nr:aspartyl/asparaginyl beta-hydroxylase domain-containing protein [Pseudomonadota bacterium]
MSQHIKLISSGAPVAALHWALLEHPELWDQNTARTENPASPHYGLSDIWCRFASPSAGAQAALEPHESVWWPAADQLPVHDLVEPLVRSVDGVQLGGVLITRIPPGGGCAPHADRGWHAQHYEKFAVQVASAPGQAFHFEDGHLVTKPGDVFWFDNAHTHWVTNNSQYERITLIVCIRPDRKVA